MGIWRDLGEAIGVVTPSDLNDVGRTGLPCVDKWIDEGVRNDIALERAREAFYKRDK